MALIEVTYKGRVCSAFVSRSGEFVMYDTSYEGRHLLRLPSEFGYRQSGVNSFRDLIQPPG